MLQFEKIMGSGKALPPGLASDCECKWGAAHSSPEHPAPVIHL